MAFIGKQNRSRKNKVADVQVTVCDSRIGFVFRNGVVPPDARLDVLIGTEEDFGYVKLVPGDRAVRPIGKKGLCCSWSASRAAVTVIPDMKKYMGATLTQIEDEYLINLNMTGSDDITAEDMGL